MCLCMLAHSLHSIHSHLLYGIQCFIEANLTVIWDVRNLGKFRIWNFSPAEGTLRHTSCKHFPTFSDMSSLTVVGCSKTFSRVWLIVFEFLYMCSHHSYYGNLAMRRELRVISITKIFKCTQSTWTVDTLNIPPRTASIFFFISNIFTKLRAVYCYNALFVTFLSPYLTYNTC